MYENIDFERLREDLINYFGTALNGNPQGMFKVAEVMTASYGELIRIAVNNGFNLEKYRTGMKRTLSRTK